MAIDPTQAVGATPRGRALRLAFGHEAVTPGRARQLVAELLGADALAEDLRLVVSELVTNAIVHTDDGGELRLLDGRPASPVRVEVEDHDPNVPDVHVVQRDCGGQGLQIVGRLAQRWGVEPTGHGKFVWAELG
jgi:anti-sigma regulatory factor (Ser/Thr protein kinase)